jgi:hypothetical protein
MIRAFAIALVLLGSTGIAAADDDPRRQRSCPFMFWLGEDLGVAFGEGDEDILYGWEGGAGLAFRLGPGRCAGVGMGFRVAHIEENQGSVVLRAAVDRWYVQAGPLAMDGWGVDLQTGYDLRFAAIYVGAYFPDDGQQRYVAGVRLSLEAIAVVALTNLRLN